MRRSIRLAVAGCAALATLAFAGPALGVYTPRLTVTSFNNAPGKSSTYLLGHVQEAADDASAKDTIFVPLGYQTSLTHAAGTKIGDISTSYVSRGRGNQVINADGIVVADSPANYPPASNTCTPGQTHEAVWRADITVLGIPTHIPIYVDHVTVGPEALYASAKIQICFQDPIGMSSRTQLLFALFDVNKVFTNPVSRAPRVWHATFTPYIPDTPTLNFPATTEGQAVVPGRVSLTLTVKRLRRGFVLIQGRLLIDGKPFRGATVEITPYGKSKPIAKPKTNSAGRVTVRRRIKRRTRYQGLVIAVADLQSCPAPPIGTPQGCKTATISFATLSNIVLARPRR
jgi:hypothetical protein